MNLKKIPALLSLQKWLGEKLSLLPLTPNQVTLLALLFAIACAFSLWQHNLPLAVLFFILSTGADAIDGAIARAKNMVSSKGAFLDGITDRLVDFSILCGLLLYGLPSYILPAYAWIMLFLFFGVCMTSFVTAYADHRKAMPTEEALKIPAMFARPERTLLLFLAILSLFFLPIICTMVLALCSLLSMLTFSQKTLHVLMYKP